MTSNLKNQIDSKPEELKFIKTSDLPLEGLSDQQKVALNRRANALLNEGKIEMAKRIFITTGYSDGLTRIGDNYNKENKYLDALKMYLLAHNKRKSEPIIEKISQTVSVMLKS
ncbi:MAG: hypothetical protein PUI64_02100 [Treponema succinifaciens]|uniref:hypothetical protein n=1 Tax=Treponema TaxID=157 RepID=UPI002355F998|nr:MULTISPECIES: hypothetical protein [Treponema]MCI6912852.1 hypothetical protein [Treponema succinifaciens]MDD6961678.1 hypothetical protein [Treponema succinifaciens]MDY5117690.1 hypothetical protein [Treponema succinifaciens]